MTLRYMDLGGFVASGALGSSPNKSILPGQQSGMNHDKLTSFTADLAHVPASSRDEQPHVVDTAGGLFARVMGAD